MRSLALRTLLGLSLVMPCCIAQGADTSPEGVLKAKGLTLEDKKFLLVEPERKVIELIDSLEPVVKATADSFLEYAMALNDEAEFQRMEDQRLEYERIVRQYDLKIPTLPRRNDADKAFVKQMESERDQYKVALTDAAAQAASVGKKRVGPGHREYLKNVFKRNREEYGRKSEGLRPLYNKVMAEYDALRRDPTVRDALKTIQKTKPKVALGPSTEFTRAVKDIRTFEAAHPLELKPTKAKQSPGMRSTKKK